ncbi:MAG TPA: hypothetical protein VL688_08000 [Verrucomicrobiae bacterium]|jgi:hypothetical protein|nr:hypothetical protein [Verrucomicrobiae bacterium]
MIRLFIYLILLGSVLYLLSVWSRRQTEGAPSVGGVLPGKQKSMFKSRANPREVWVQVYETATLDEARRYQARIQEEEIECIIYEQGKKDIHGNPLMGIGIAVPKTAVGLAQGIISRISV